MKRVVLLATIAASPLLVSAEQLNLGVNFHIGQPEYYGQIDVMSGSPPALVYPQPIPLCGQLCQVIMFQRHLCICVFSQSIIGIGHDLAPCMMRATNLFSLCRTIGICILMRLSILGSTPLAGPDLLVDTSIVGGMEEMFPALERVGRHEERYEERGGHQREHRE